MLPRIDSNKSVVRLSKTDLEKFSTCSEKNTTRGLLSRFFNETQNQFNCMRHLCGRLSSTIFPVKKEEKKSTPTSIFEKIEVVIDDRSAFMMGWDNDDPTLIEEALMYPNEEISEEYLGWVLYYAITEEKIHVATYLLEQKIIPLSPKYLGMILRDAVAKSYVNKDLVIFILENFGEQISQDDYDDALIRSLTHGNPETGKYISDYLEDLSSNSS